MSLSKQGARFKCNPLDADIFDWVAGAGRIEGLLAFLEFLGSTVAPVAEAPKPNVEKRRSKKRIRGRDQ